MFNNIFPNSIARYHQSLDSNNLRFISVMNSEDYLTHKDLLDNPFQQYFHQLFKMYITSYWLNTINSRTDKELATHTTYIEANLNKKANQNMIIMKQPLYTTQSKWEDHISRI